MAKKKNPTPQEIYLARKKREEEERHALLPPGLINHGNTCFMNSVLQGLLATHPLASLLAAEPIPAFPDVTARRSPLLMNGHGIGYDGAGEHDWVEGMPLGDVFVVVMRKAWKLQIDKRRESFSPKQILSEIGKKYDQYLDFAQQDAHEFLRQLLDAMRMEEMDIIKKRNPPPPTAGPKLKRRRTTIVQPLPSTSSPSNINDQPATFVDMLFGGQLTSILVCQKCKHVSQTYEDFNDLSLSIKPEDYVRDRKRDRLKMLAKKLKFSSLTASVDAGSDNSLLRPASVPPPKTTSDSQVKELRDQTLGVSEDERRKSWDVVGAEEVAGASDDSVKEQPIIITAQDVDDAGDPSLPDRGTDESSKRASDAPAGDKKRKSSKEKTEDGWAKISRRLSMSVGIGKDRKGKSRDRRSMQVDLGAGRPVSPALAAVTSHDSATIVASAPIGIVSPIPKRPPEIRFQADPSSPLSPPSAAVNGQVSKPTIRPSSSRAASRKSLSRPSTPSPAPPPPAIVRSKSPKPPKQSRAEVDYLAAILADISSSSSSNPFHLFRQHSSNLASPSHPSSANGLEASAAILASSSASSSSTWPSALSANSAWLKLSQVLSVEDCLRMFTAVEIMDGENSVGCRQCWKIANGVYDPPVRQRAEDGDDSGTSSSSSTSSSSLSSDDESKDRLDNILRTPSAAKSRPMNRLKLNVAAIPSHLSSPGLSVSTPVLGVSNELYRCSSRTSIVSDNESISSLPIAGVPPPPSTTVSSSEYLPLDNGGGGGAGISKVPKVQIPMISTTTYPDVPSTARLPPKSPFFRTSTSLQTPRVVYSHLHRHWDSSEAINVVTTTDDSSGGEDSEVGEMSDFSLSSTGGNRRRGAPASILPTSSDTSSATHAAVAAASTTASVPQKPKKASRAEREKQVLPQPHYKRYLISKPPPILVIHLKRFQQLKKSSTALTGLSFSSGFKKVEDQVIFEEFLDLGPFLAPKREEFGLGKDGGKKLPGAGKKGKQKCMYRLYAVVVHLGNMLGGHYVAYTALPSPLSPYTRSSSLPTAMDNAASSPSSANFTPAAFTSEENMNKASHPSSKKNSSSSSGSMPRAWAYISDTTVRISSLEEALKSKAYLCMYERYYPPE